MSAFTNAGNPVKARIAFNSAQLDFGNNRFVQIDNVSLTWEWTITELYVLNSIMPQDIVHHSFKVTLTGKLKSFAPDMDAVMMGSSQGSNPVEIDPLDGQPTLTNPVLTLTDRNGNQIQYQLSGAVGRRIQLTTRQQEYNEWDFELEAKNIAEVYTP